MANLLDNQREERVKRILDRKERYGNEADCILGAHIKRWQAEPKENGFGARHLNAWRIPGAFSENKHDRMFRLTVAAIIATWDAVNGPSGDALMRPHLLDMIRAAQQQLDYLGALDGGWCWHLLNDLCRVDGFTLDTIPSK